VPGNTLFTWMLEEDAKAAWEPNATAAMMILMVSKPVTAVETNFLCIPLPL